MIVTAGIDIGSNTVKASIVENSDSGAKILANSLEKIRRRKITDVIQDVVDDCLNTSGQNLEDLAYIATTGNKQNLDYKSGHFYGMTSHARGACFLRDGVKTVVDIGAFHTRAMKIDERGKVLAHSMTGQCASGTGQFVENITRYLGISIEEVGPLSLKATEEVKISSICAVLSETDVINLVSQGTLTKNIIKGIHITLAERVIKLIKRIKAEFPVFVTGGMAIDIGLLGAIKEVARKKHLSQEIYADANSIYAGSLGAAILGAYRLDKISRIDSKAA